MPPVTISDVPDGLAPYHFAGMVNNSSVDALHPQPQRILIIGSMESGNVPAGVHEIPRQDKIEEKFGSSTTIAKMLNAAFEVNPYNPKFGLAVPTTPAVEEVKPSWEFTFETNDQGTGPGSVVVGVCGYDPVTVSYTAESFTVPEEVTTEQEIKDYKINVLLSAVAEEFNNQELPFDISVQGSALTIEDHVYGTKNNLLAIAIEVTLPGFSVRKSGFRPGVNARTVRTSLDVLPEIQFTQIATDIADPVFLKALNDELEQRWGSVRQIDGHAFVAASGLETDIEAEFSSLSNLKHLTVMATSDSPTPEYIWAATLAAVNARYAHEPYRPYQSIELPGIKPPATEVKLAERNSLLSKGFSTHAVDGLTVSIDRLVTRYTKDPSYRDLNKKQILSYLRYDFVKFLKEMYPRHALSRDETQADGDVATPMSARDLAIARHNNWKRKKYVQDPGKEFKKLIRVSVPDDNESLLFYLPVQLMGQLRRTITTIAFTP